MTSKILLLGLDGADPFFVEEHRSELPFLSRFMEQGVFGRLSSTIPPVTGPAWSSAMSGMNPGKTGIIGFEDKIMAGSNSIVNSTNIAVPRIWDILSYHRKEVGVMAVPLTYPPSRVNGFMVSGFLTPSTEEKYTYPVELRQSLPPGYRPALNFKKYEASPEYFLKNLYSFTHCQFKTLSTFLREKPWDFFTYVLSGTDWIQHFFCNRGEDGKDQILRYFKYVDDFFCRLERELPSSTIIFIISDHGFGKQTRNYLYLNTWLKSRGLFHQNDKVIYRLRNFIGSHLRTAGRLPGARLIKQNTSPRLKEKLLITTRLKSKQIDWSGTRAMYMSGGYNAGYIKINIRDSGREEIRKLQKDIIDGLHDLERNAGAGKLFQGIFPREEIYQGQYADQIPEIIIVFADSYSGQEVLADKVIKKIPSAGLPGPTHRMEGILMAKGPGIKNGFKLNAEIYDIAPTIYHLQGLPVPEEVDGKVLINIFQPGSVPAKSKIKFRSYDFKTPQAFRWENKQEKEVRDRLKALGYLD
jgi:predicted AlkP superfamily phosphohydrolase/phosphomutase